MRGLHRDSLSWTLLLYWTSFSMVMPLLAPFLRDQGVDPRLTGLVVALHAVPGFLLVIPLGALLSRLDASLMVSAGAALMACGGVVLAIADGTTMFVVSQVLCGLGETCVWLSLQMSMVSGHPEERIVRIANFSLVVVIGQLLGPPLGGVLTDHISYRAAFATYVLLGLVLVAVEVTTRPRGRRPHGPRPAPRERARTDHIRFLARSYHGALCAMRNRRLVWTMVVSFAALYLLDIQSVWHPLYFGTIGLNATTTGIILSVGALFRVLSRFIFHPLMKRLGGPGLATLVVLFAGFSVGGVSRVDGLPLLFALAAVSGTALGLAQPLTLELVASVTTPDDRAAGIALRLVANRLGSWLNPMVFGLLLPVAGLSGTIVISAAGVAVVGCAAAVLLHRSVGRADPSTG